MQLLNDHWLGGGKKYLCGDQVTIADYMGAEMIALGGLIGCKLSAYPNIERWLGNMRKLKPWAKVHETIDGFAASLKGQSFVAL